MGIALRWFLPTNGDSRTDLSLGNEVGAVGNRVAEDGGERAPQVEEGLMLALRNGGLLNTTNDDC